MSQVSEVGDGENILSGEKKSVENKMVDDLKVDGEKKTKGLSSINVESIKSTFTGMSKEELMKFANDPFWIRIRWFLFVSFWFVWALMLFGAIFIIVGTPKCEEAPIIRVWHERSPVYEINLNHLHVPDIYNYEKVVIDFLNTKFTYLRALGIETVLLRSTMESTGSEDEIINYMKINVALGVMSNFQELAKSSKQKGIRLLLDFTPNHSSDKNELFARSILKEYIYEDFYIWKPLDGNNISKPPNNWLSVYGASAWEYDNTRKEFYLHQFKPSQPEFNFRNPNVLHYFEDVLNFWLEQGVSGFHVEKAEYLVEDDKFRDEGPSYKHGYVHDQYEFYTHKYTKELPETTDILKKWSDIISNKSGILSVTGGIGHTENIANLLIRPLTLTPDFDAADLNNTVHSWLRHSQWPAWKWQCSSKLEEDCISDSMKDGLLIVSCLLPGVPVIHLGQELGYPSDYIPSYFRNISKQAKELFDRTHETGLGINQENDPESHYNIFKTLMKLRKSQTIMHGKFNAKVVANKTVFCFTRIKDGQPGYLVAWNLGVRNETIYYTQIDHSIFNLISIEVKSGHQFQKSIRITEESGIIIPAKAAIVIRFAPK